FCFVSSAAPHASLHSFPTRRSSDLGEQAVLDYFGPVAGRYFLRSFHHDADGYRLHGSVATFRDISEEWGGRHFWDEWKAVRAPRSEEHTSELQSRENLVCRLLLEKK